MIEPYAEFAADLTKLQIAAQAREHYRETESYQQLLVSRYRRLHHWYAPANGDQWPEDAEARPGKIHATINGCKPFVDVDARLQALIPRVTCAPHGIDPESRKAAETAEKTILRFLELSDWEVWLAALAKTKTLYGKGVLKPFWNVDEDRPDVSVIESPENLRLGWGQSDFSTIDWALYEYGISPAGAKRRWPDVEIERDGTGIAVLMRSASDHTDPLNQKAAVVPAKMPRPYQYQPSDYEREQLRVWDYWYLDEVGVVTNALLLEGTVVEGPNGHPELLDIPYIPIENDHEPGSPEGIATHEHIVDTQVELNRAMSHWMQLVADETDHAYQLVGPEADSVPPGLIPRGGQVVAPGAGARIDPIATGANIFALDQLVVELWRDMHRLTGMSEILFGNPPGAQTAGRALAVQVEAAANRLDFKRRLLYKGFRRLILFWVRMLEHENPKITLDVQVPGQPDPVTGEQTTTVQKRTVGIGDSVRGFYRWKIVAPEITPRDVYEQTTNIINQVGAKIVSLSTARDLLGYDSPEDEEELIVAERSNAHLFPGEVQTYVATMAAVQDMKARADAAQAAVQAAGPPAGGIAAVTNQVGQGAMTADQQNMQPTRTPADQGIPAPATLAGGPPPGVGGAPGAAGPIQQTLIRAQPTGQAVALNQISYQRPL